MFSSFRAAEGLEEISHCQYVLSHGEDEEYTTYCLKFPNSIIAKCWK